MENTVYKNLNPKIKAILNLSNGWLVGGAVADIIMGDEPSDYDIVVDTTEFHTLIKSLTVNHDFTINNYGGFKFEIDGFVVDVWSENLSHFILAALRFKYAYNFKSRVLLSKL